MQPSHTENKEHPKKQEIPKESTQEDVEDDECEGFGEEVVEVAGDHGGGRDYHEEEHEGGDVGVVLALGGFVVQQVFVPDGVLVLHQHEFVFGLCLVQTLDSKIPKVKYLPQLLGAFALVITACSFNG